MKRTVAGEWDDGTWESHVRHHSSLEHFLSCNPDLNLQAIYDSGSSSKRQRLVEIAVGLHLSAAGFRAEKLPEHSRPEVDFKIDDGAFYVEVTHLSPHSQEGSIENFYDELKEFLLPTAESGQFCIALYFRDFEPIDVRQESAKVLSERILSLVSAMPPTGGIGCIEKIGLSSIELEIVVRHAEEIGHVEIPIMPFGTAYGSQEGSDAPYTRLDSKILAKKAQLHSRSPVVLGVYTEGSYTDRMELDLVSIELESASRDPRQIWAEYPTLAGILLMNHDRLCSDKIDLHDWCANPEFAPPLSRQIVERLRVKRG